MKILSVVALLVSGGNARQLAAHDTEADTSSVGQIRDTLNNLHTSIRDAGLKNTNLFGGRQQWCESALADSAKREQSAMISLRHLRTDLEDQEAAVEETEGTIHQLENDIVSAKLLVNSTQKMYEEWRSDETSLGKSAMSDAKKEHVLKTMLQNRAESINSLQSELDLVQPVLAQLQSRAAETKRRYLDREHSVNTIKSFTQAVTQGCAQGGKHLDTRHTALSGVEKSVEVALKALDAIDNAPYHKAAMKTLSEVESTPTEVSFVQTSASSDEEDDLASIFGDDSPAASSADNAVQEPVQQTQPSKPKPQLALARTSETVSAKTVRPQIQKLLADLKKKELGADTAQKEWCGSEQGKNAIVLSLAQAEVNKTTADINLHSVSEAAFVADSQNLAQELSAMNSTAADMLQDFTKEKTLITGGAKDQKLATRILAQAIAILNDLESSDLPGKSEKGAERAVVALRQARVAFQKQTKAAAGWQKEVDSMVEIISAAARESSVALEQERMNLGMARDNHASERERCAENNRAYADEVEEATNYLKKLQDECTPDLIAMKEQQRSTEVNALNDAETVLDGQAIKKGQKSQGAHGAHSSNGLRGAQDSKELSPMERAAMEMGVAVEADNSQ